MDSVAGTVIIVNAARADAERYARMLRSGLSETLDIAAAADIDEGLALCREGMPYCVLLAHEPPTVDGLAFVASLKFSQAASVPPMVLIYGQGSFNVAADALKRGVDNHISKGDVSEKLLVHAVRNAVEKAALRHEVDDLRAELARLQFYDPVTDLATRRLFDDRMQHAVDLATRLDRDLCLLLVDLDGLRDIHENSGLLIRDRVLREVGQRLSGCARQADVVARLGNDEFAILMESGVTQPGAEAVAERVIEGLGRPFDVEGAAVTLGITVGISLLSGEGGDRMVRCADMARLQAKYAGSGYHTFREADDAGKAKAGRPAAKRRAAG